MKRKYYFWGALAVLLLVAIPTIALASGKSDLATIRKATARYRRLAVAEEDGFVQFHECIDNPTEGAMGTHYILSDRFDDQLNLQEPEVLVYDVGLNGKAKLVAIEYVVPAAAWSSSDAPTFLGQTLQYKTTMGPYQLDPYYEVHVWTWRRNPSGMFADWNPRVACPAS